MRFFRIFAILGLACTAACQSSTGAVIGSAAPDFSLPGTDGKTYVLSQLRGQKAVVLAWFPKAMTSGCTAECKSLRDSVKGITSPDVAYFAASVDVPADNKKFSDNLQLTFPILSDPTKATARAYGVLSAMQMANRWTFYIAKDGELLDVDKAVNPETAGEDIKAHLKKLGLSK